MKYFDQYWLMPSVATEMRRRALLGTWDGVRHHGRAYFENCRAFHEATGTVMIFTRDTGMHASGVLKNPDYERCFHLSLSYRDPASREYISQDKKTSTEWCKLFYGDNRRLLWVEPPMSPEGKSGDVYHYRLFCDPAWQPILPRKEVYSRDFTEAGWKSFSDLQWEKEEDFLETVERGEYAQ